MKGLSVLRCPQGLRKAIPHYGPALLAAWMLAALPAQADLAGDTVHVNYLYPGTSDVYINFSNEVVTAGGAAFDIFGHNTLTVLPTVLTVTNDDNISHLFLAASFNGFSLDDVSSPGKISGATIDPSSNLAGFDASRVFFSGTTLFLNFQGLNSLPTTYVQIDLTFVPEPGGSTLLATGLIGAFLLARRKLGC